MSDDFGDRMKLYEAVETSRRFDARFPVYARIDGRGFSKFTRGMRRPFDPRMSQAMIETTKHLVQHTNAKIGYTQSDEISLVWWLDGESPLEQMFFDGKVQKLCSVLAGQATAAFTRAVLETEDDEFQRYVIRMPHFDARVFQLPMLAEGANAFLWRCQDARRNAISMTAQSLFSHSALQGKSTAEMLRMTAEQGIDFEAYPHYFTRGTFLRRELRDLRLSPEDLAKIPERYRPDTRFPIIRSEIVQVDMPPFGAVTNREDVIFYGADPVTNQETVAIS